MAAAARGRLRRAACGGPPAGRRLQRALHAPMARVSIEKAELFLSDQVWSEVALKS